MTGSHAAAPISVRVNGQGAASERTPQGRATRVTLKEELVLRPGLDLVIEL
jgi:hypothetical protein